MLTLRALPLSFVLFSAIGCASQTVRLGNEIHADRILVVKSEHTMTLFSNGKPIQTYKIALGRGHGNAKQREGDHETPEGLYIIDSKNMHSRFHRALHISYPNTDDNNRAKATGVKPGGQIMIHGIQNGLGWLGSLEHEIDWTDGCIAVTDSEIEEISERVSVGTPIEIRH